MNRQNLGGRDRFRTCDPLLAKQDPEKTLNALFGVAYTTISTIFALSVVPKLYRVSFLLEGTMRISNYL
jgi:hypothetical protein